MVFLVSYRIGELGRRRQLSCVEIEGVEYYHSAPHSAAASAALDLDGHLLGVQLTVHGAAATKLDHAKLLTIP
jgi:hypothetical protein